MNKKLIWEIIGVLSLGILLLRLQPYWRGGINHKQINRNYFQDSQVPKSAMELWQMREFASIGNFEKIDSWPNEKISDAFPNLNQIPFLEGVKYTSPTIQSVEVILSPDAAQKAVNYLGQAMTVNTINKFRLNNQTYIIGLFDWNTAKQVNGFVDKSTMESVVWLSISIINSDREKDNE
jgi:hypothetical protein